MNPIYQAGVRYRLPDGSVGSFEVKSLWGTGFFILEPKERAGAFVKVLGLTGGPAVELR